MQVGGRRFEMASKRSIHEPLCVWRHESSEFDIWDGAFEPYHFGSMTVYSCSSMLRRHRL